MRQPYRFSGAQALRVDSASDQAVRGMLGTKSKPFPRWCWTLTSTHQAVDALACVPHPKRGFRRTIGRSGGHLGVERRTASSSRPAQPSRACERGKRVFCRGSSYRNWTGFLERFGLNTPANNASGYNPLVSSIGTRFRIGGSVANVARRLSLAAMRISSCIPRCTTSLWVSEDETKSRKIRNVFRDFSCRK